MTCPRLPCNDQIGREAEEQAMFDDPAAGSKQDRKLDGTKQRPEVGIEDQVAVVAVERLTPRVLPECNPRTQPFEILRLRVPAEGKHFYR